MFAVLNEATWLINQKCHVFCWMTSLSTNICATSNKFQCRLEFKSCKNMRRKKLLKAFKIFRYFMAERVGKFLVSAMCALAGNFVHLKSSIFTRWGQPKNNLNLRKDIIFPFENRLKYALLSNACLFSPFGKSDMCRVGWLNDWWNFLFFVLSLPNDMKYWKSKEISCFVPRPTQVDP